MSSARAYLIAMPAMLLAYLGLSLALGSAHHAAGYLLSALAGFVTCDALISSEVKP